MMAEGGPNAQNPHGGAAHNPHAGLDIDDPHAGMDIR